MADEKSPVLLPHETSESVSCEPVATENQKADERATEQLTFRGKPISWITVPRTKTRVLKNAFGDDDTMETVVGFSHLIDYEGQQLKRDGFLAMVFPDYKKYRYKVRFKTDDIFRLGSSMRAKLQYHILAQQFPLVEVSEKDKSDLKALCNSYDAGIAKHWLARMNWKDGHEKMISFGAALEVRGEIKGVWCYYPASWGETEAIFEGVHMTWETWAKPIIERLDDFFSKLSPAASGKISPKKPNKQFLDFFDELSMMLSYQNGTYLTLPGEQYKELKEWVRKNLFQHRTPFPYTGEIPDSDYSFTIDFEKDTEIVESHELRKEMGEYNRQHNAAHNKEMGRKKTEERFENLKGDKWTTQEIHAQGFSRKTLDTFVKHGLIRRIRWGHYERVSV